MAIGDKIRHYSFTVITLNFNSREGAACFSLGFFFP